ncbi:Geranylgeranyl pyrophosphate synthase/Polyprenyl synthetase [Pyrenophora tritici-repentis]|nr:Geranylgeranyl pyrophosphate synthase/Polyprenyl synthetase [Pyrenophora tritici-repentis]
MSSQALDDATSYIIPLSTYDTHGLCTNYPLRRHKWEAEANAGSQQARSDWIKYIGPIEEFGTCNPINGNYPAVALPFTKPERLSLIAYLMEYLFLYDTVVEHEQQEWNDTDPALGRVQLQAKILLQLASTDSDCTERVKSRLKEALAMTLREKDTHFDSLEQYLECRMVDCGAPLLEALSLFGMGVTLTEEEDAKLEPIRRPCFIAIGLANDYLSFDREYLEFSESVEPKTLKNAVWLHMQWYHVDVSAAKKMVLDKTRQQEDEFLENCARFRRENNDMPEKLNRHLEALAYQVSGNVVWSLNCPRYCPDYRYDPNAGIEDVLTKKSMPEMLGINYDALFVHKADEDSDKQVDTGSDSNTGYSRTSSTDSLTTNTSTEPETHRDASTSSCTSAQSSIGIEKSMAHHLPKGELLDCEHIKAPFDYISSLPSKGARDVFIDALNIWLNVPAPAVSHIKSISNRLHSASLMLDDIEDGSSLRRGQPATHTVFGTAQTINSGCWEILNAVQETQQLGLKAVKIVLEELSELHIGQSYDLYWTEHSRCPSEDEYLEMVSKKTGGLFRLIVRLLLDSSESKAPKGNLHTDMGHLAGLIGIQYQIRDDYQNLYCRDYGVQKGFCQDLDEGKFSFPLLHALSVQPGSKKLLCELIQRRRDAGCLSYEQKLLVLEQLDCAGSMTYTRETLKRLQGEVHKDVKKIEDMTGKENWILRALLQKLKIHS